MYSPVVCSNPIDQSSNKQKVRFTRYGILSFLNARNPHRLLRKQLFHKAIFVALLFFLLPAISFAAQVTLQWDPNNPTPEGYCVYQRQSGGTYDYNNPAWPTDGNPHTETSCTITGLTEGATYNFIVKAHVGSEFSGDSNEVTYQAPASQPPPNTYTIEASSGANGSISPSGSVSVTEGNSQIFNFAAASGYQVAGVEVNGQSMGSRTSYTFSNVTQNQSISVTFSAIPVQNQPPVAEAGNNQSTQAGTTVTVDGSGSHDPESGTITYLWRQSSGPAVSLSGRNTAQCTFTAPVVTANTTLSFELTVTDGPGQTDSDTCLVTVSPAQQEPDNDNDGTPDAQDPDDDNDGMPDVWEIQYGLNPFVNDASGDVDNDGVSNYQEFRDGTNPTTQNGNQAPLQPTVISPTNDETGLNTTLWLNGSAFDDPDSYDSHARTRWQISAGQTVVMDQTVTNKNLTKLKVPRLVLNPSTQYTVRVRYYDESNEASPWSNAIAFTTIQDNNDKNHNRIPDDQEVSVHTDMNDDGTPDINQEATVKSVYTFDDQYLMGVSIQNVARATELECAANIDPMSLETPPPGENDMAYGLLGYKVRVDQPGDSITSTIYLSDPVEVQTSWACYDSVKGWRDCSPATTVGQDGFVVQRNLTDGGTEDADGTANGVVVDLSGPGEAPSNDGSSNLAVSDGSGAASGGSGGGCFIGSVFDPK